MQLSFAGESLSEDVSQAVLTLSEDYATAEVPSAQTDELVHQPRAQTTKGYTHPVGNRDIRLSIEAVDAPVSPLLFTIAQELHVGLDVVGSIDGSVTLRGLKQPAEQLLDHIARQARLSWSLETGLLRVWGGDSYTDTYPVNYLNLDRVTFSRVGLATQVGTINAVDAASASVANSSQTLIENRSDQSFWRALDNSLQSLLSSEAVGTTAVAPYSINREAGLITITALPAVHQAVKQFLSQLHQSARRQVLIEATVLEITLSDGFSAGIDWQILANGTSGISAAQRFTGQPVVTEESASRLATPAGLISLVQQASRANISATLSFLEQFGNVRILSRPRIMALNNQPSVLKVVDNRVYFTVHTDRRQTETKDELITETRIHTVPVGLVMNVTPQISEDDAVMLNVRPSLSRILGFVNDPNPELAQANVRNGVPEIQVREIESMLEVPSGELAIIGGLMQELSSGQSAALPALGRIPLVGKLFSQQTNERRQTELVIVLKPTVIAGDQNQVAMGEYGSETGLTNSSLLP